MLAVGIIFWAAWFLILYTYLVFPIVLAICARRWRASAPHSTPTSPADELPRVAMVVAAYNEASVITDKLANAWALDYPADGFQLVVGSDGSSDPTMDILRGCDDPRLHRRLYP